MINIALIEDDPVHRELIATVLEKAGYAVAAFGSVLEFRRRSAGDVDLILLDWQLPGESGIEFMRSLRLESEAPQVPVVFLTGTDDEQRVVEALRAGADDYLVKPARPVELIARIEAVLRRTSSTDEAPTVDFPPFKFRTEQRDVLYNGTPVKLSSREYELVWFLFQRHNRIVGRETLLRQVWRMSAEVNTRTVDTYMSRVRKRLDLNGESGWKLAAVYHHGYRLMQVDTEDPAAPAE